ncbi:MAG TPA: UDP-N-acetylmuramoyl-L-alanine--D-glutamate ligase [Terriglobia bacterium]|nr:UDP-N-acetylmuramoyl-L-alanine--D-glutamate ligase [Terriglobia bacterium]
MKLDELNKKSILILGFGTEGQATYEFIRRKWPSKPLSIADRRALAEFPEELARRLQHDPALSLNLGAGYLDSLAPGKCEVIIKTPGIPASTDLIAKARKSGCLLTSHSQIFLSNYPREKIIGVTGTKGKSTTTSLIYRILKRAGLPAELVGNIGQPPLAKLMDVCSDSYFVHEFSSHQLAEIESSPHIAVLLNIVPEHLDYYETFDEYAAAKENITRFQEPDDFLVFNPAYPILNAIAHRTRAALRPFNPQQAQEILNINEVQLPGKFNLENVMAAVTAASLCGVEIGAIQDAVKAFRGLPHRLELVGTYNGVTFYDDSIATVPDATLGALDALGSDVQTLILGGHERHLDFTEFGIRLPGNIKTAILFPPSGERIWKAIELHSQRSPLPEAFFVQSMELAVALAYERTEPGKICLLSPASPSFGMFKDYRERGESFKAFIKLLSNSGDIR